MTEFDDVPLYVGMTTDPGDPFPGIETPLSADQARTASGMRSELLTAASLARDEHMARLRLLRLCAHPSFAAVALESDGRTIALPLAESAARLWGNLRFGLRDRADPCEREAFARDMETNVEAVRLFRTARTNAAETPDDNDMARRRLTAVLLDMLPVPLMAEAVERCLSTRRSLETSGRFPTGNGAVMPVCPASDADGRQEQPSADIDGLRGTEDALPENDHRSPTGDAVPSVPGRRPNRTPSRRGRRAAHKADVTDGPHLWSRPRTADTDLSDTPRALDDTTPEPALSDDSRQCEAVPCPTVTSVPSIPADEKDATELPVKKERRKSVRRAKTGKDDAQERRPHRPEDVPARTEDGRDTAKPSENAGETPEDVLLPPRSLTVDETHASEPVVKNDVLPSSGQEEDVGIGTEMPPEEEEGPGPRIVFPRYRPELVLCPEKGRDVDTLECHACAEHDTCPAYA